MRNKRHLSQIMRALIDIDELLQNVLPFLRLNLHNPSVLERQLEAVNDVAAVAERLRA
ncbi:hypothetical protein D3C80_1897590 [compost metagenome]